MALHLLGGGRWEAEEAVQETWLRAARGLSGFEWRSSLRTWLTGILIRCARERGRRGALDAEPFQETSGSADDPRLRATVERVAVERALASLPPGYREVLVLHDLKGYTHGEIGRLLGIQPGTSKSQLHHARRALRASLGGGAGGEREDEGRAR